MSAMNSADHAHIAVPAHLTPTQGPLFCLASPVQRPPAQVRQGHGLQRRAEDLHHPGHRPPDQGPGGRPVPQSDEHYKSENFEIINTDEKEVNFYKVISKKEKVQVGDEIAELDIDIFLATYYPDSLALKF